MNFNISETIQNLMGTGGISGGLSESQLSALSAATEASQIILWIVLGVVIAIVAAHVVVFIASYWILFKKAGKRGFRAIIPIVNVYTFWAVGWRGLAFWIDFLLIIFAVIFFFMKLWPVAAALAAVAFVMGVIAVIKFAKAYGKSGIYALGLIFIPVPFYFALAMSGEYQYAIRSRKQKKEEKRAEKEERKAEKETARKEKRSRKKEEEEEYPEEADSVSEEDYGEAESYGVYRQAEDADDDVWY